MNDGGVRRARERNVRRVGAPAGYLQPPVERAKSVAPMAFMCVLPRFAALARQRAWLARP